VVSLSGLAFVGIIGFYRSRRPGRTVGS
jgi:hypothetical protein